MNLKQLVVIAALGGALGAAQAEMVAYTWAEGDTIETVAGQYDVTVEQILISNGLETDEITVGTVIYIPPKHAAGYYNPDTGIYTIAEGDDLSAIAERFGTTVEALEEENILPDSKIIAGKTLLIPRAE